jgi:hypothetical protein
MSCEYGNEPFVSIKLRISSHAEPLTNSIEISPSCEATSRSGT